MDKPVVVVVGKPNVGKSTLVNRLLGRKEAIIDDLPGVTRDRRYFEVSWEDKDFILIDTGGLDPLTKERIPSLIRKQVEIAIEEADLIVFLIDGKISIDETDKIIASKIRCSRKPSLLVVNKIDSNYSKIYQEEHFLQAYKLGLGEPLAISSMHGLNIEKLLDKIVESLTFPEREAEKEEAINVAIVGRPNVGKSSLLNKILGEERLIVDEIGGTTRDSIDVKVNTDLGIFNFIDTAGIRKKKKISKRIERYSIQKAFESIRRSDLVLLMLEVLSGLTDQDKKITSIIEKYGKGGIILVNKCDLVELDEGKKKAYQRYIKENLTFGDFFPVLFISALNGEGIEEIFEVIVKVFNDYQRWISTGIINGIIWKAYSKHKPPAKRGKNLKIYYTTQIKNKPPTFLLFVNYPNIFNENYQKYITSQIRKEIGFLGTPIKIKLRKRS